MTPSTHPGRFRISSGLATAVLLAIALLPLPHAGAAVTVNPAETVTHRVVVQPIRTKKSNGETATFMGGAASEAYIKEQIDVIWSQSGIDIEWLDLVDYTDDFTYDGSPGNYNTSPRPQPSHLNSIVTNSGTPPRSTDSLVINLFFVRIPPGFRGADLGDYIAAGYAYIDRNGAALYIGGQMTTSNGNRDIVASVIAHEIGHNLGLSHVTATNNLMYLYRGDEPPGTQFGERLDDYQDSVVFTNDTGNDGYDFLRSLEPDSRYLEWAATNALAEGPEGDDDRDGLSNAFEFLYGTSPMDFTAHPTPVGSAAGNVWTLGKEADAVADGFSFLAESGPSLDDWLPAGQAGSLSEVIEDSADTFSVRLQSGHPSAFLRFDVAVPDSAYPASPVTRAAETPRPAAACGCQFGPGHAAPVPGH